MRPSPIPLGLSTLIATIILCAPIYIANAVATADLRLSYDTLGHPCKKGMKYEALREEVAESCMNVRMSERSR